VRTVKGTQSSIKRGPSSIIPRVKDGEKNAKKTGQIIEDRGRERKKTLEKGKSVYDQGAPSVHRARLAMAGKRREIPMREMNRREGNRQRRWSQLMRKNFIRGSKIFPVCRAEEEADGKPVGFRPLN